jgi:hypothetical protein
MNIVNNDSIFFQEVAGETYGFSFEKRIINDKLLLYCYLYHGQVMLGQARVNFFEGNNLEIHLKNPKHRNHSKKNILLCRLLDRAVRPLNIKGVFIITLIDSPIQENLTRIFCHYALFAALARKSYLGCAEFDGGFLSCSSRGIMALELTQDPSWDIGEKIQEARKNAEKFINFLKKTFPQEGAEKESADIIEDEDKNIGEEQIKLVRGGENFPREAVRNYLGSQKKRLGSNNPEEFRRIEIFKGPGRVDFKRGDTYVSSYVRDLQHTSGFYDSQYDFFRGRTRRTIGHNSIIKKTIGKIVPKSLQIAITSEVISSDGSTSMASICSQSMLLKHLGFNSPLVAGLSFGGFGKEKNFFPLVDICALEDKYGECDCKIAASELGIISINMDTKSPLSFENFFRIIELCKRPLLELIGIMKRELPEEYLNLPIPQERVGLLVGRKGRNLDLIRRITGIKTLRVNGEILVLSKENQESALKMINPIIGHHRERIILEIKNTDPLAIVTGKVENRGLSEGLAPGKIVEAKWLEGKEKPKVIEILEILE